MTVVPDSIEPVIGWRGWKLNDDGFLTSQHTGEVWTPGERLEAVCQPSSFVTALFAPPPRLLWVLRSSDEGGLNREQAQRIYEEAETDGSQRGFVSRVPPPPRVELPRGYGYALEAHKDDQHSPPGKHCVCGIYAVRTLDQALVGGIVGRVALWGKVIPGDKGWRGQFAYPVDLFVPGVKNRGRLRQRYVSADVPDTLLEYKVPLRGLENVDVVA